MTHILKLLYGDDRRTPDSELNLNQLTTGEIRLSAAGLTPNAGALNVQYSDTSIRFDGEIPVGESRGNMKLELKYNLAGGSAADITRIQRQIEQYARYAALNGEGRAEAVWFEYRWNINPDLDNLPRPAWGQLNYYARVLSVDTKWPDPFDYGGVNSGIIEGVLCTLTCEPYWDGLEQVALDTSGLIDVVNQTGTIMPTAAGLTFSGQFAVTGWFKQVDNLVDYNLALRYYIDGNNYFSVYQQALGTLRLLYKAGGVSVVVSTASSGNITSPNHFVVIQDATAAYLYINGVLVGSTPSVAWGAGTLYVGCQDASGTYTETTTTIDGLRFFNTTLTAAQIAALYAEELPVKTAGGWIGKPPYHKTTAGAGLYHNLDGTLSAVAKDNWGVVGNVNGDAPGNIIVRIQPPTSSTPRDYWLSRLASLNSAYTPAGSQWLDLSGVTDTGNSSGDAYEQYPATLGLTYHDFDAVMTTALRGKFTVMARGGFDATRLQNSSVKPVYRIGSGQWNEFEGINGGAGEYDGSMFMKKIGSMYIDWPGAIAPNVTVAVRTSSLSQVAPFDSALAAYRLDETSGTRYNYVGSDHLTPYNSPTTTSGYVSSTAISLASASSQYLKGNNYIIETNTSLSLSCWVKLTSKGANRVIVSKWTSSSKQILLYFDNAADRFKFSVTADNSTTVTATATTFGSPSLATWYHIYAYYDKGTGVIGISINNGTANTTAHTGGIYADEEQIEIGSYLNGTAWFMNGAIDEVYIFNRILTSGERLNLSGVTAIPILPNLVFGTVDFIALLPSPACHVKIDSTPTIASGDTLVVDGKYAYVTDASDGSKQLYSAAHEGEPLTVEPGQYNIITLMQGNEDAVYPLSNTATVTISIIPRWTMPGGLVA